MKRRKKAKPLGEAGQRRLAKHEQVDALRKMARVTGQMFRTWDGSGGRTMVRIGSLPAIVIERDGRVLTDE